MRADLLLFPFSEIFDIKTIDECINDKINIVENDAAFILNPQYHIIKFVDSLLKDKSNVSLFQFEYLLVNLAEDKIYNIDDDFNNYIVTLCHITDDDLKYRNDSMLSLLLSNNILQSDTHIGNECKNKIIKTPIMVNGTRCICVKNDGTNNYCISKFNAELKIAELCSENKISPRLVCFESSKSYCMEWVEGLSIRDFIKQGIVMSEKLILIKKLVNIFSFLHSRNILYGDIHSSQFLIDCNNNIWLIDYGQSININNSDFDYYYGGCYFFLVPEYIFSNAFNIVPDVPIKPSLTIDVYALGVLIYYIIYEEYPFNDCLWGDLYKSIKYTPPKFYRKTFRGDTVPFSLIMLINKCLSKEPKDRYSSVCVLENEIYSL